MDILPPGAAFILRALPRALTPPAVVCLSLNVASSYAGYRTPLFVSCAAALLALPAWIYLASSLAARAHRRAAAALHALPLPQVQGRWPGNVDLLLRVALDRCAYLGDGFVDAIAARGTTFAYTVLGETKVLTANPENFKRILAHDFDNFIKGPKFDQITGSVLGRGVFNSDGQLWQFHRKLTRPFFDRERVRDFAIFDAKAALALARMSERFDTNDALDFQDIAARFTLDSAAEFLLGATVDSLSSPLPEANSAPPTERDTPSNRFARAFANAQVSISARGRLGAIWPLFELGKDRTRDDMREVRAFIEPIVAAAVKGKARDEGGQDTLLHQLLSVTDDMKTIVDEVINIMLAGRDTTASLLTFVVYCLAMDPCALARLRAEVLETVGPCRAPTFDDIRDMRYLRAVLNETLRLFPPVPFNHRYTVAGTTLLGDDGQELYVPPGSRVTCAFMLTQRHEAYWGKDAHVFDPDRWLDARLLRYVSDPYRFVPFNAGPRICLGQQFALHEAAFFVVRLLQRFERFELAPECQPADARPPPTWAACAGSGSGTPRKAFERCVPMSHLTMYAKGGLWLRMREAKTSEVGFV